jgi:hypothetical protein
MERHAGFFYPKDVNDRLEIVKECTRQIAILRGMLTYYDPDETLRTRLEEWKLQRPKTDWERQARIRIILADAWWQTLVDQCKPLWNQFRSQFALLWDWWEWFRP